MNTITIIIFSLTITLPLIIIVTWVLTLTKGRWNLKIFSTTVAFIMLVGHVFLINHLLGRPKHLDFVDNFIVISYQIHEPSNNNVGLIRLWGNSDNQLEPLNISIPYSKNLHKQLEENDGLKNNRPQILEIEDYKQQDKVEYKLKDFSSRLPPKN